jgi:hypothetical protein
MSDTHDCVKRVNDQLREYNTRLASAISFSQPERELIALETVKADPFVKKKPVVMYASHCPFCGVKLKGGAA